MSEGIQWHCPKCSQWLWNHYEHCTSCGEARPRPPPPEQPTDEPPLIEEVSP